MQSGAKGKVFVSYSRKDRSTAERLVERLRSAGFETLRDLDNILPTESWRERLEQLIVEADSIVFLLSPSSAASDVCAWEVELASALNKKIAPIVIEDVEGAQIPAMLSRLNYIFATQQDRFENAVETLCDALSVDIEWLREHSRLLGLARRWEAEPSSERLLTVNQTADAEVWVAARPASAPQVAAIVQEFIEASMKQQRLLAEYNRAKLSALIEKIEPLVNGQIEKLTREIRDLNAQTKQRRLVRIETLSKDREIEISQLRNFLSANGRWHPQPATHVKTLDATMDYAELFQFPCCEAYVMQTSWKTTSQFRADGCAIDPSASPLDRADNKV